MTIIGFTHYSNKRVMALNDANIAIIKTMSKIANGPGYKIIINLKKIIMFIYVKIIIIIIIILTCSKALAVYVTRMAGKVPSFMAFLKTSEKYEEST